MKPIKIGQVHIKKPLFLAPLAGFTDIAFRRLCRDAGAGLTTTEMVSVRGLCHGNEKTQDLLRIAENETPSSVQLFGNDPVDFVSALNSPCLEKFDLIDINMGCPMPKITGNGDGSALLKDAALAGRIVEACVKTGRTITVKVRLGTDDKKSALSFCRGLESAGASMIAVHGRTAKQMYTGVADWDAIGNIAANLHIPVVGNGDIFTKDDIVQKFTVYPVAGLMLGRGALGNPYIFSDAPFPPLKETMLKHLEYSLAYFPQRYTVTTLRKHFVWYLKGVAGVKDLKTVLMKITNAEELIAAIRSAKL